GIQPSAISSSSASGRNVVDATKYELTPSMARGPSSTQTGRSWASSRRGSVSPTTPEPTRRPGNATRTTLPTTTSGRPAIVGIGVKLGAARDDRDPGAGSFVHPATKTTIKATAPTTVWRALIGPILR